ncbi:MAG: LamB/YcsF family protein, partial [Carbonactinosporaceae bacterium]
MAAARIDVNADLGESFGRWRLGDDDAMLDLVTSANVACGFHAGDPSVLRATCERAAARGVVIGAQVGYRDLAGFGRRFIDVDPPELTNDVIYQIGALEAFCRVAGARVAYVKPHGALYNAIVHHEAQAVAVAEAVSRYDPALPVLGLPGSVWLAAARDKGLTAVPEAFADRAYTAQGTL